MPTLVGTDAFRETHLRDVLYGCLPGRPFSLDVPQALVPEVRRGRDNGGALPPRLPPAVAPYVHALQPQRIRAPQKGDLGAAPPTYKSALRIWSLCVKAFSSIPRCRPSPTFSTSTKR